MADKTLKMTLEAHLCKILYWKQHFNVFQLSCYSNYTVVIFLRKQKQNAFDCLILHLQRNKILKGDKLGTGICLSKNHFRRSRNANQTKLIFVMTP